MRGIQSKEPRAIRGHRDGMRLPALKVNEVSMTAAPDGQRQHDAQSSGEEGLHEAMA